MGVAVVPPLPGTSRTVLNDFAENRIQKMWLDPDAEINKDKIPVFEEEHYQSLLDHGGILLNGLWRIPKLLTDPIAMLSDEDLQPPENGGLEYLQWTQDLVAALQRVDTPALAQLFIPSLAKAIEIDLDGDSGNGTCLVYSPTTGRFEEDDNETLCRVRLVDEDALQAIADTAYFEAAWGQFTDPAGEITDIAPAKLLGIPVGKGQVTWTAQEGLQVYVHEPILGQEIAFTLDSRDIQVPSGRGNRFTSTPLPRAFVELGLSTTQFATALQNLGLPLDVSPFPNAEAMFLAATPGFAADENEDDALLRNGGVALRGRLDIAGLLNDAEIEFSYELAPGNDAGSTPQLDTFRGLATVQQFRPLGALAPDPNLLSFSNVVMTMSNDNAPKIPQATFSGDAVLLGQAFSLTTPAPLMFHSGGVLGELDLEYLAGANTPMNFGALQFDAGFEASLVIDTNNVSLLRVEGNATLGQFRIVGIESGQDAVFEFSTDSQGRLSAAVSGALEVGLFGRLDIDLDRGGLLLAQPAKIAALFELAADGLGPATGEFSVQGDLVFEFNNTGQDVSFFGRTVSGGTLAHLGIMDGAITVPATNPFISLQGDLEVTADANGHFSLDTGDLEVARLFGRAIDVVPDWIPWEFSESNPIESDSVSVDFDLATGEHSFSIGLFGGTVSGDVAIELTGSVPGQLRVRGEVSGTLDLQIQDKTVKIGEVTGSIDQNGCMTASIDVPGFHQSDQVALVSNACQPYLSLAGRVISETSSQFSIPIRLSQPAPEGFNVQYAVETIDGAIGSLHPADGDDFTVVPSDWVYIEEGATSAEILVTVYGDNEIEFDEAFQVRIRNAGSLPLPVVGDRALVVIENDDELDEFPGGSDISLLFYDFEMETLSAGSFIVDALPEARSDVNGSVISGGALVLDGLTQPLGEHGPAAVSYGLRRSEWGGNADYVEFTVSPTKPIRMSFLDFWSSPLAGSDQPQQWEVYWSVDDFATPIIADPIVEIDTGIFGEDFADVVGAAADGLVGWRRHRAVLPLAVDVVLEGHPGQAKLPLNCVEQEVTFRIYGTQPGEVRLDNVELFGSFPGNINCDPGMSKLIGEVLEFYDKHLGRVTVDVTNGGEVAVLLQKTGPSDPNVTDPVETSRIVAMELLNTNADSVVTISVGNRRQQGTLDMGQVYALSSLGTFDAQGVPGIAGSFEFNSLASFLARDVAGGSSLSVGVAGDLQVDLLGLAGAVDLEVAGKVSVEADGWGAGRWRVGELGDVWMHDGDLQPDIEVVAGFGSIRVDGGDFASSHFVTGLGPAQGDGSGAEIVTQSSARAKGGSLLVSRLSIDGDVQRLTATGGDIRTALTAAHVGAITASSVATLGGGDLRGTFDVQSVDQLHSIGGVISASLVTSDAGHSALEVLAEPDGAGLGGVINSPHSFYLAGGAARIAGQEVYLHLDASGDVELLETLSHSTRKAILEGSFSARRFVQVSGRVSRAQFVLHDKEMTEDTDIFTRFDITRAGEGESSTGIQLIIDLREPNGFVNVSFEADEDVILTPLVVATLNVAVVYAGSPGQVVGPVSESLGTGAVVSDDRFMVSGGLLRLKPTDQLELSEESVTVTVSDAEVGVQQSYRILILDHRNPWHNNSWAEDVDGNGFVSPRDVLLVIRHLNQEGAGVLPIPPPPGHWYVDVTNDGFASPRDALTVIGYLNQGGGEGEAPLPSHAAPDSTPPVRVGAGGISTVPDPAQGRAARLKEASDPGTPSFDSLPAWQLDSASGPHPLGRLVDRHGYAREADTFFSQWDEGDLENLLMMVLPNPRPCRHSLGGR